MVPVTLVGASLFGVHAAKFRGGRRFPSIGGHKGRLWVFGLILLQEHQVYLE